MIDTSKQYTYNGKPVRIYADGSDTSLGRIHGAVQGEDHTWYHKTFLERDLVEVWEPKEGEIIWVWDKTTEPLSIFVRRFLRIDEEDKCVDTNRVHFNFYAPFKGTLPEAFKGLV